MDTKAGGGSTLSLRSARRMRNMCNLARGAVNERRAAEGGQMRPVLSCETQCQTGAHSGNIAQDFDAEI